ncbi:class F sortase [Streptomyces sp. NPDC047000]|uniref:class F sortase n=1 Tax=Streptomyces sp. NPDC047000 TaxID=3155474 RepID=UPI0033FEE0BF
MTALSRRAFTTASLAAMSASLLTACGGGGSGVRAEARTGAGSGAGSGSGPVHAGRASGTTDAPSGTAGAPDTHEPHALARSVPVRLRIPAVGVDTPVIRLGLASDGTVEVPPVTAHDRAGWYRNSPAPGQAGPSVILGHVTVGSYGDGVFRRLAELRRGDRIAVRLANGTEASFGVTRLRTVAKSAFPSGEVYGDVDRPELRLITCGGPRTGTGYLDNVIVFAALTSTG